MTDVNMTSEQTQRVVRIVNSDAMEVGGSDTGTPLSFPSHHFPLIDCLHQLSTEDADVSQHRCVQGRVPSADVVCFRSSDDGRVITVHRVVLAAYSSLMSSVLREAADDFPFVSIEYDSQVLRLFSRYICTGVVFSGDESQLLKVKDLLSALCIASNTEHVVESCGIKTELCDDTFDAESHIADGETNVDEKPPSLLQIKDSSHVLKKSRRLRSSLIPNGAILGDTVKDDSPRCDDRLANNSGDNESVPRQKRITSKLRTSSRVSGVNVQAGEVHNCKQRGSTFGGKSKLKEHIIYAHKNKRKVDSNKDAFQNQDIGHNHKLSHIVNVASELDGHHPNVERDPIPVRVDRQCEMKNNGDGDETEKQTKPLSRVPRSLSQVVSADRPHQCSVCQAAFRKRTNLREHMHCHATSAAASTCVACGKQFRNRYVMKRHLNVHKPYACAECRKRYATREELDVHVNRSIIGGVAYCARSKKNKGSKADSMAQKKTLSEGSRSHVHTNGDITDHITSISAITMETIEVDSPKPEKPSKSLPTCTLCNRSFAFQSKLRNHMLIHSGKLPLACPVDQCHRHFRDSCALNYHLKVHTQEKPHLCIHCGKSCALNYHLKVHTQEKPHLCIHCGKRFIKMGQLNTHLQYHSAQRNHMCETCGNGYISMGGLRKHIFTNHREMTFLCPVCVKQFLKKSDVERHLLHYHPEHHDVIRKWRETDDKPNAVTAK